MAFLNEANMNNYDAISSMPKTELHAHLNGSLSYNTLKKLLDFKKQNSENVDQLQSTISALVNDSNRSLDECFQVFKVIHNLTDSSEAIYLATVDVIKDFAEDNIYYLELRTTPRPINGSLEPYVDAVLRGIDECKNSLPILVKLLLSVDRSKGLEFAKQVIDLTIDYGVHKRSDVVVGLDVSGNMTGSNLVEFFPLLGKVKQAGLNLTVHTAEIRNDEETEAVLLRLKPDRIGHGTFISPSMIGSAYLFDILKDSKIPVEICLTSNVVCRTVPSFENHHIKELMTHDVPFSICTDDKGVFGSNLSQEYLIASKTFNLSVQELWNISWRSIDYTFAKDDEKECLRRRWKEWLPLMKRD